MRFAILNPFGERARLETYASSGLQALAMEFMPRITRAQSMDILSSQSNLSGYTAVLDAAAEYGRAFPMMMTAAGTVSAARAFIMRSDEHTSELPSLMRISYAVFCFKKKHTPNTDVISIQQT